MGFFGFFFLLSCVSSLYFLNINPLSDVWFASIFSHSKGCLLLMVLMVHIILLFNFWSYLWLAFPYLCSFISSYCPAYSMCYICAACVHEVLLAPLDHTWPTLPVHFKSSIKIVSNCSSLYCPFSLSSFWTSVSQFRT